MVSIIPDLLKTPNPKLREQDPITVQKTKEGFYAVKLISETQVAERKLRFFAGLATDKEVADFFNAEADQLAAAYRNLQTYYETLTME